MAQLKAAVQSGADAVYLGAGSFSARAGADNFDYDALSEAVKYCRMYGVKVHCALNTLIKEKELPLAVETAVNINNCGVDAIIIQDIGLASHIKRLLPDIELHASTQMTVTSLEGVKYLEEHGFSRVVLARELSLKEIERIANGARAEIEVFVHGAICECYSGQCLMSSMIGGRSGNRGRCAQPCRRKYDIVNGQTAEISDIYALSPKDMSLIDHLSELRRAGVASLKIEGRLKSPEYVSAVVGVYRRYIDNAMSVTAEDKQELKNAFSRSGFTDGYFTGTLGRNMMSHDNPANNSGSIYTDAARERAEGKVVRRIPISIFASLREGDVLRLTAYDENGNCAAAEGTIPAEKAVSKPLDEERMRGQLSKLGATVFCASDIGMDIDEGITIPVKEINETRRRLIDELVSCFEPECGRVNDVPLKFSECQTVHEPYLTAEVTTAEQAEAVLRCGAKIRRMFVPPSVAEVLKRSDCGMEIVTKTADIYREEKIVTDSVSVSSFAALHRYGKKALYGDFRLNIYNSLTVAEFSSLKTVTLSPELNLSEIRDITSHTDGDKCEVIGYGYIPLMIMKNCPVKALGKCMHGGKKHYRLRDNKNKEFTVMCGSGCGGTGKVPAVLLNSLPIYTADILNEVTGAGAAAIRLCFTVESGAECERIIDLYKSALDGKRVEPMAENTFTRGHLKRGVI